jgi:hypothetical protein
MNYAGKYKDFIHQLAGGRWLVGRWLDDGRFHSGEHVGSCPQDLAGAVPSFANERAAIKAARRAYPELQERWPWAA